jgi:hypothetical protein
MQKSLQLEALVAPGTVGDPWMVNPDGTQSPFSIPHDTEFVVTDISIQGSIQPGEVFSSVLLQVSLMQQSDQQSTLRWNFVGSGAQNIERAFNTGIAFSTPFVVQNGADAPAVIVRMWGFFQETVPAAARATREVSSASEATASNLASS